MKNTRAEELMAAHLSGNIRPEEKAELMAWVSSGPEGQTFFDKTERLWGLTEDMAYPDFSSNKKQVWEKVAQRTSTTHSPSRRPAKVRTLRGRSGLAIAASVAILLVAGWWWQRSSATAEIIPIIARTVVGEQQEVTLPDGTKIWLNETTEVTYEDRTDERYLAFSGEAYFDVATDSLRPFRIYTSDAVTTVLGTAFNLRAYPEEE
ncbi:MAG: FecR domain-containing protein, partial [Bacteroidota bacterium]